MKVSDYIANFLSKKTQYVFGGQGGSVVHLINSIDKNKKISFVFNKNYKSGMASSIKTGLKRILKKNSIKSNNKFHNVINCLFTLLYLGKLKESDNGKESKIYLWLSSAR